MLGDINSPNLLVSYTIKHCHPILEPKAELTHFFARITHVFEGITHVIALISTLIAGTTRVIAGITPFNAGIIMLFNELLVSLKEFLMAFSYHCSFHISIFNGELRILKVIRL